MVKGPTREVVLLSRRYAVTESVAYSGGLLNSMALQYRVPQSDAGGAYLGQMSSSKDVLVVEDESYLRDLVADVLDAEGHRPRKAANGFQALDCVRERIPQLILLDLMMPVMDGWEFMKLLRANPEWVDIPVVIVTAAYDVRRTQEQTGARAVLTKPFDIDQIAEVVRTYAL